MQKILQHSYLHAIPAQIRQALSPHNPLFVACSGGRDSMALLFLCHALNLPIVAIHINHRIQAPSDDWEAMVKDFCQRHDIPFLSKRLQFDTPAKVSEQSARHARYEAIGELTNEFFSPRHLSHFSDFAKPIPIIALAHHANDQAETLLINLCQGTGLQGLSGMSEWGYQGEFSQALYLWRPLLTATREQISDYIQHKNIPYIDDPTNVGEDNQRAFLRQQIMPLLEQRFGGAVQNIARTSQNMAQANTILQTLAHQQLATICLPSWTRWQDCLSISRLRHFSEDERFSILHTWLKSGNNFAPPRRFITAVNRLILLENSDHSTILQWQNGQIRRYRDTLYLLSKPYITLLETGLAISNSNSKANAPLFPKVISPNNANHLQTILKVGEHSLQILMPQVKTTFPKTRNLSIRLVQTGEKFLRANHLHHQTFKNICQTLGVPSWERGLAWVVEMQISLQLPQSQTIAIALVFPNHAIWLASAENVGVITTQLCPFKLQFA